MRILWIGTLNWFFSEKGYLFPPINAAEVSGSSFEQSMIEGLESLGHHVQIITDVGLQKRNNISWSHNGDSNDYVCRDCGKKYISIFQKIFSLKKIIDLHKIEIRDTDFVVVYSVYYPFLNIANFLKNKYKHIKVCLVCPDLPLYNDPSISQKFIKRIAKKIEQNRVCRITEKYDCAVWFAPLMATELMQDKPSIVIEGICSNTNIDQSDKKITSDEFIMYAGSLNKNFGIQNLIKAYSKLDINVPLKIYGNGELDSYIRNASHNNPKIVFGGLIGRRQLFEEEKKATLLLNFRNPNEEFTKYSFPSKMIEYMSSGTPVLTTKLEGFPDEYDEYLMYVSDNSEESISDGIRYAISLPQEDLRNLGERARHFVMEKKNNIVQSQKLIDFLSSILNQ